MKLLLPMIGGAFITSIVYLTAWAVPPKAPIISPASSFVSYGSNATLTALRCSGTVTWSTGATGTTLVVTPKEETKITATCTVSGETSTVSNIAVVTLNWDNLPCNPTHNVTGSLANVGRKYEANQTITATNSVQSTSSVRYNARQSITLNPGFQTFSNPADRGAVFKAYIEGCAPLQTRDVITGLTNPWEILWGPDNFIWMTERPGTIYRVDPVLGTKTLLLNLTAQVSAVGESGMLGMVLHPDFANNPYVYIVHTYHAGMKPMPLTTANMLEKVVRYTYTASPTPSLSAPFVLIDAVPANSSGNNHFGSRLVITPDLKMFISFGDINNINLPQDLNSLLGKVLRINLDGSIPTDNPFGNRVWTLGHRNPQGLVYANGKLYSCEHGPNTDDEVNWIQKGRNYGWPTVWGHCDNLIGGESTFCADSNVVQPLVSWFPTSPATTSTIAPGGMDYYNNDAIPQWKNSLLVSILKNQHIRQLKLDPTGSYVVEMREYFNNQFNRIRDICISPAGKVYFCTDSGRIVEVSP
jgi:aldose sugar dehydrogenase